MTYTAPTVSKIGTFEEITQANQTGSRFDSNFRNEALPNILS